MKTSSVNLEYKMHVLSGSTLFAGLEPRTRQEIAVHVHEHLYEPGQMILSAGEPCQAVYLVVRGRVHACRISHEGREYLLGEYGPGELFNLASVLDGRLNLATVTATTETHIYAIPCDVFREIASRHQGMTRLIQQHLASQVRDLTDAVADLALYPVRARLARYLLEHARRDSNSVKYWTQQEIALHIGSVRDVVGRTLRAFAGKGLIRREGSRLEVTDVVGLKSEAMNGW